MVPTGEQLRAARALIRIDQRALAQMADVSLETIKRLELINGPVSANTRTVDKIVRALQAAGVIFIEEDDEGPGVRLRKPR